VYALHHPDGRWLYSLPGPKRDAPSPFRFATHLANLADGQPMTHLRGDWWVTGHQAERITAVYQPAPKTTGYRLLDLDAVSTKFPATLTVEDYRERSKTASGEQYYELYQRVEEDQPPVEYVYDGLYMVLAGREPPAPDEPQWVADLPHELTERPEYKHLFPGHIPHLRNVLIAKFQTMPHVEHVFDGYQDDPSVYVSLRVPYEPPRTRRQAAIGARGQELKSGARTVPVLARRTLHLPIPYRITGPNYATALAEWSQAVEFWTGLVREASVKACDACDGTGYIADGGESFDRAKK
jgi:hypothetical protein